MPWNIIIAAALFLLTSLLGYAAWYILFRANKKEKTAEAPGGQTEKEKDTENISSSFGRDSYCYPGINDVMGYNFVEVVKVPDELLSIKEKTVEDSFASARPVGITAVTNEQETGSYDDIYDVSRRMETPRVNTSPEGEPSAPKTTDEYETADGYTVVNTEMELDPEEIDALNMIGGEWNHRDYDKAFDDEMIDAIMDNNANDIEQADFTEEDMRIAREKEELERFNELELILNTKTEKAENDVRDFVRLFQDENQEGDELGQ